MTDVTKAMRRLRQTEPNTQATTRQGLEARHGRVWDSGQLQEEFEVLGFQAPAVVVRRIADGVLGSLAFQQQPRFYFNFRRHHGN